MNSVSVNAIRPRSGKVRDQTITLAHGGGGKAMRDLIDDVFVASFANPVLAPLEGHRNAIVLVTDLEALHPYLRIGAIESQLQGKCHVPTVFLYPGVRTGKTHLKFLGFYPEDGHYRSVHVGG